jgi:hypothetical protein
MATLRQKKAIKHIEEGDSVSKAMKKAGYAPSTAKNPDHLTKSLAFKEVLESVGITDLKLGERLNEGLDATKAVVMGVKSEESFVDVQPDFMARHKYIETSLKLKGHMVDKPTNNTIVIPIYGGLSGRPQDVPLSGHNSDSEDI